MEKCEHTFEHESFVLIVQLLRICRDLGISARLSETIEGTDSPPTLVVEATPLEMKAVDACYRLMIMNYYLAK